MKEYQVIELFERIKRRYQYFRTSPEILKDWTEDLADVEYELALYNLRQYALNPDNTYPPHPGALARPRDAKTAQDIYHDWMSASGRQTIEEYDRMRANAVPPTDDQRRRIHDAITRARAAE